MCCRPEGLVRVAREQHRRRANARRVQTTVQKEKPQADGGIVFSLLAGLFLAGCLFFFFRNNALLAHGGRNLWHVESLVMLGVLGIPFVLVLLHLFRGLRRSRKQS